jgi:hypothetical protein
VRAWKIRSQPGYAAELALERDHGVCSVCRLDCVALARELEHLARAQEPRWPAWQPLHISTSMLTAGPYADRVRPLGLSPQQQRLRRRLWEMDHVVPVVEGGGSCGLENLRTLCWSCHRQVTAELRARLAERRRAERGAR